MSRAPVRDVFGESSHCHHWIFSDSKLRAKRQDVVGKDLGFALRNVPQDERPVLKLKTYKRHLRTIEKEILQTCADLRYPEYVAATSIMFFKRFYLTTSFFEVDARKMAYTCIFLAQKCEDGFCNVENLAKQGKFADPRDIVQNEIPLLSGLSFQLRIFHAYRPLEGFLEDVAVFCTKDKPKTKGKQKKKKEVDLPKFDELNRIARGILGYTLRSDAMLLYPPSQVALCALWHAGQQLQLAYIVEYFNKRWNTNGDPEKAEKVAKLKTKLEQIMNRIQYDLLDQKAYESDQENIKQVWLRIIEIQRKYHTELEVEQARVSNVSATEQGDEMDVDEQPSNSNTKKRSFSQMKQG